MDPNVTLAELREAVGKWLSGALDGDEEVVVDHIVERFQALDEWIVNGGFLPEGWTPDVPARRAATERVARFLRLNYVGRTADGPWETQHPDELDAWMQEAGHIVGLVLRSE